MTPVVPLPDIEGLTIDTLVATHELVDQHVQAAHAAGGVAEVGTPEFLEAAPEQQLAALLVLAEAYLIANPEQRIKTALIDASHDVCAALPDGWCHTRGLHRDVDKAREQMGTAGTSSQSEGPASSTPETEG